MHALTVIPARLASTRLPNKVLADIAGLPMIVQVWRRVPTVSMRRSKNAIPIVASTPWSMCRATCRRSTPR